MNNAAYYLVLLFAFLLMISNALAETIAIVLLGIWVAQSLAYRRKEWLQYPLFMPIAALVIYKTIVISVSGYQGNFGSAFEQLALPLIYFILPTIIVTSERRGMVIWLFLSGAVLASGFGIIQFLADVVPRATSIVSGPVTLGIFLVVALGFAITKLAYAKSANERLFLIFIIVPLLLALIFTRTRIAYLSLTVILLITGIIKERRILVGLIVLTIGMYFVFPKSMDFIIERFNFQNKSELYGNRGILLEYGMSYVDNVDYFGYGINSFPALVDVYADSRFKSRETLTAWHNMYLDSLFDGGPILLFILIWLIMAQGWYSFNRFRKTRVTSQKVYQFGILMLLIGVLIIGMTDNAMSDQIMSMTIWTLLGMSVI